SSVLFSVFFFRSAPCPFLLSFPTRRSSDLAAGFPIRTSSDHRSVVTSPRLIADSHVLRRLLVPRHPPCALEDLGNTTKTQNLIHCLQDARVHYAVLKKQPHTTRRRPHGRPPAGRTSHTPQGTNPPGPRAASHPNSVSPPRTTRPPFVPHPHTRGSY